MDIFDCISVIRQFGSIYDFKLHDSFEDNVSKFILKNHKKSIWLTESAFEIKVEVHLENQGDINTCIINKIDNAILDVHFSNSDFRVYNVITLEEFINSLDLTLLDKKQATLNKISVSFIHCINNLIPENIVVDHYVFGNPYYFNKQTDSERKEFEKQTINFRRVQYDWLRLKFRYLLANRTERLRFIPPLNQLNKVGIFSYDEIIENLEENLEYKNYKIGLNKFFGVECQIKKELEFIILNFNKG